MESNYIGKIFWTVDVALGNDVLQSHTISRVELKEYITTAPEKVKSLRDVDIINKYVIPYIYDIYKHSKLQINYVIVKRSFST